MPNTAPSASLRCERSNANAAPARPMRYRMTSRRSSTATKISAHVPTLAQVTIGSTRRTVVSPLETRLTRMKTIPDELCTSAPVRSPTSEASHVCCVSRPMMVRSCRPVACRRLASTMRSPLKNRPSPAMMLAMIEVTGPPSACRNGEQEAIAIRGCPFVVHARTDLLHEHNAKASNLRVVERIRYRRIGVFTGVERHAIVFERHNRLVTAEDDGHVDAGRRLPMTHDVGDHFFEDQLDVVPRLVRQLFAIEQAAQRAGGLVKSGKRPGDPQ